MIGNGTYDIEIWNRGGETKLATLRDATDLHFTRRLDDTSEGEVTCISDEWADLVHPWMHELHIFRNKQRCWCGPVRDKVYDPGTGKITVTARDLFCWFDFRVVHDEIDMEESDMADVFAAIATSALRPDPSPNITMSKKSAGSNIDFYHDEETQKIAAEYLRELADSGVDFTQIMRTLYVSGEEMVDTPTAVLTDRHFSATPNIKESGEMATLLLLTGPGGDYHSHPDYQLTADQWDRHTYGLLETVVDATTMFDSDDATALEKAAKSRYELVKTPRVYISDATLDKSAPVTMDDLIPGRRVDIRLQPRSVVVMSQYRLQSLDVKVSASDKGVTETIELQLSSLGDLDISKQL